MKNKGISLIVLIITIVVIIIIATAIIASLVKTNIIKNANEAVIKQDFKVFQEELTLYTVNKLSETNGKFEIEKLNATKDSITYIGEGTVEETTIYAILTSLQNSNYEEYVIIENGKIAILDTMPESQRNVVMEVLGSDSVTDDVTDNENSGEVSAAYVVYLDDKKINRMPTKSEGYFFSHITCTEGATATLNEEDWSLMISNFTNLNTVSTIYFYTLNDWKILLKLAGINASKYESLENASNDTDVLKALVGNKIAWKYLSQSTELDEASLCDKVCSNESLFSEIINNEEIFLMCLDESYFREAMYNNYGITQSLLANSNTALNTIKKSEYYTTTTCNSFTRVSAATTVSEVIYNGKAFLLDVKVTYNSNRLTIGTFLDGTANYSLSGETQGSGTINYSLNKFMQNIMGAKYNCNNNPTAVYSYLKI